MAKAWKCTTHSGTHHCDTSSACNSWLCELSPHFSPTRRRCTCRTLHVRTKSREDLGSSCIMHQRVMEGTKVISARCWWLRHWHVLRDFSHQWTETAAQPYSLELDSEFSYTRESSDPPPQQSQTPPETPCYHILSSSPAPWSLNAPPSRRARRPVQNAMYSRIGNVCRWGAKETAVRGTARMNWSP